MRGWLRRWLRPQGREPQIIAGWLACPDCDEPLPVTVTRLRVETDDQGRQSISADLQTDDLWAHSWTHT